MMLMRTLPTLLGAGLLWTMLLPAADLTGIWTGEVPGRNGEKQDLSFQFQAAKGVIVGVMFGDEFDLPVEDLELEGDHVSFSVVSTNYYNNQRTRTVFTGTVRDKSLELNRQQATAVASAEKPKEPPLTLILKRLV